MFVFYFQLTTTHCHSDFIEWINSCRDNESLPGIHIVNTPFKDYNVSDLEVDNSAAVDPTQICVFNNDQRRAIFYGPVPYSYGNSTHEACENINNANVRSIYNRIRTLFPYCNFNSLLINLYFGNESLIPLHSDDENCINYSSWILGLSLGQERIFQLYDKFLCKNFNVRLKHGDIIMMSRASQNRFKHAVRCNSSKKADMNEYVISSKLTRVSFTFRVLIKQFEG